MIFRKLLTLISCIGLISTVVSSIVSAAPIPTSSDVNNFFIWTSQASENIRYIDRSNADYQGWCLAPNKFLSYSNSEFIKRNGFQHTKLMPSTRTVFGVGNTTSEKPPVSFDWRDYGRVGPIKDQKSCGSCWSFSAVVPIEAQNAALSGKYTALSEQDLVDCVKNVTLPGGSTCCDGCGGGLMSAAYEYFEGKQHGRDDTETQYPYKAIDEKCRPRNSPLKHAITDYVVVDPDEAVIKHALWKKGPLSIAVNAGNAAWQFYRNGVYSPSKEDCDPSQLDHGVALVGWGNETGKQYWIIRNSWGKDWGANGYMHIAYGTNACGLTSSVSYPILK